MKIVLFTTSDMRGTRRSELYRLLASSAGSGKLEIVHFLMLQDCTEDDEAQIRSHANGGMRISALPGRLGISAARNVMLAAALSEGLLDDDTIVAFPDDDCWYPPLFLGRLEALFRSSAGMDFLVTPCDLNPDAGDFNLDDCRATRASEIIRKSSSNSMFLRGDLARKLRGYDETLGLGTPSNGGEDTDYAVRAYLSGHHAAFIDRAIVGHPAPTPGSTAKYYHGALLVLARHARSNGEVRREFVRKLAVGGYLLLRRRLGVRAYLHALAETGRLIQSEWRDKPAIGSHMETRSEPAAEADEISLLYCVDSAYFSQACVSLASVLASNPATPISVTIAMLDRVDAEALRDFSNVLSAYPRCRIRFRDVDLAAFAGLPTTSRFSASIYARIILARFMDPVQRRVLYLDADTIIESDLRPLWRQELGGKAIAAVRDRFRLDMDAIGFAADEPYFNSGVILFDMQAWRERNYEARVLDIIECEGDRLPWMDQDALNIALRGDVAFVDDAWNFQPRCADVPASFLGLTESEYRAARIKPHIIHYTTSLKPWNASYKIHYSDRFFRMVLLAGLERAFVKTRPQSLQQRSEQFKTRMRWRFPRLFRWVRTVLRPQAAALMYRAR